MHGPFHLCVYVLPVFMEDLAKNLLSEGKQIEIGISFAGIGQYALACVFVREVLTLFWLPRVAIAPVHASDIVRIL